ncbi:UDP-N-acetylmuramoyl-L-alanyl-D-glutamate--2,6-diaminopimelate ligase [Sporosarcina luteola]|uniref:Mur ligase family protein n=1 Tax=Sporosarcina luteola TaxID=582850 RepID=UPI0020412F79|nr:UDP-N-acetylmuramoyl-L-alanyl-D-glutamate--2,6-diaminopimelate ligase [Sporosarcina luteola]MCM3637984.1 UDP-N-acetylmuramoyl-L-alanyl-D-glutamate--2,6-diaminopimelate ligase [Sporosarcina luteola]
MVSGSVGVPVSGITERSGNVREGFIFVARKGARDDGVLHVQEAIERGAVAIVFDRNQNTAFDDIQEITLITVPDGRKFISHASAKLAGNPSESLKIIAVTGTNGKTTVTHFIGQLLTMLGEQAAVIGTTGIFMNGRKVIFDVPEMTTLQAEFLHPLLKKCLEAGMKYIVMEASSLGLSTSRLDHCKIDIGVFLNIGVDHYEEHGSKEAYLAAKKRLATMARNLVVNGDDRQCIRLVENANRPVHFFNELMVAGRMIPFDLYPTCLPGKHNRLNALAAVTVMEILEWDPSVTLPLCDKLILPEGRLQCLREREVNVYIDYAHTPDALQTVLASLTEESTGELITVFGCGGNRDRGKRPQMGKVATTYSTKVIITTDNPRNEEPSSIIEEILAGINCEKEKVIVEMDRRTAIEKAIRYAKAGDIVLIAGKGHERTQQIGQELLTFSDYEVAEEALRKKN